MIYIVYYYINDIVPYIGAYFFDILDDARRKKRLFFSIFVKIPLLHK